MTALSLLDLFAGIGGFSLGLEATGGFRTGAFVEINPFCQKILRKHWPDVPIYKDVNKVSISRGDFNVLSGGFPCQDVSLANQYNQQSILGDKSGLWYQYLRLIEEGRPQWVLIENVENLLRRGLTIILGQLAKLGYDAEWHVIPAYAVGLPHVRKRLWVVAYHNSYRVEGNSPFPLHGLRQLSRDQDVGTLAGDFFRRHPDTPRLCRSSHGIPSFVDRIAALGNAIVPAIAYHIGNAILEAEGVKAVS